MRKELIRWLLLSAFIMLVLPWMAVHFAGGDAGMAVCFILFYAVNPIYSIITGVYAGRDVRYLWELPVISPALFLIGTWLFFDMGEIAFIIYSVCYLGLGMFAMAISALLRNYR